MQNLKKSDKIKMSFDARWLNVMCYYNYYTKKISKILDHDFFFIAI